MGKFEVYKNKQKQRKEVNTLHCDSKRVPLKLVLPTGSMEQAVLDLFEEADMKIARNGSRGYDGYVNDPRVLSIKFLRPQDIPRYVARGIYDLGITGQDWVEENNLRDEVVEVCTLPLTRSGVGFARIVLCTSMDTGITSIEEIPDESEIETEYPNITRKWFESRGKKVKISLSHGCTEAKVPHICPAVVELTETGVSLRKNNLIEIEELFRTTACMIVSKPVLKGCRDTIDKVKRTLMGAISGRGKVMLKFHMPVGEVEALASLIPHTKTPTINNLKGSEKKVAVEIIVTKEHSHEGNGVNLIIDSLIQHGATDIVEIPVGKWISS